MPLRDTASLVLASAPFNDIEVHTHGSIAITQAFAQIANTSRNTERCDTQSAALYTN
jgi:hypothetical protein